MKWSKAWKALLEGKRVRRSFWEGYWKWEDGTIMMHTREGKVEDIRNTEHVAYTFTNIAAKDWVIVDDDLIQQEFEALDRESAVDAGIGHRIAKRLLELGMTQRQLAKKCGYTEVTISRYVNELRTPDTTALIKMAQALMTTPDSLCGFPHRTAPLDQGSST